MLNRVVAAIRLALDLYFVLVEDSSSENPTAETVEPLSSEVGGNSDILDFDDNCSWIFS